MLMRFMRFPGGKSRALTLSYDDGVIQDIRLIEILKKHGIKCTFNINSGLFPPEEKVFPEGTTHRRLKQSEVLQVYDSELCEVACHSYSHPFLAKCDPAMVTNEVLEDRKALEALFGHPVQGMAYPQGSYSDMVVQVLENCGIRYCRTVVSTE